VSPDQARKHSKTGDDLIGTIGCIVVVIVISGGYAAIQLLIRERAQPFVRIPVVLLLCFAISWWIEPGWRAAAKSLVWGGNFGVLVFALGCLCGGILAYGEAAWPAITILVASRAALKKIERRTGAIAQAATSILAPTAIGTTVVLAILLFLTVATLDSLPARYFEARFIHWYEPLHKWLERVPLVVLVLMLFRWALHKQNRWAKLRLRSLSEWSGQTAHVIWLVSVMLFTADHAAYHHGMRPVARLGLKYEEDSTRLAAAQRRHTIYSSLAAQLAQLKGPELSSLKKLVARISDAAGQSEPPPLVLDRGFPRFPRHTGEDLAVAVGRKVAAQDNRGSKSDALVSLPDVLRLPAIDEEARRKQISELDRIAAHADTAEKDAESVWQQGISVAFDALPDFGGGLAKLASSYLKALAERLAEKGIDRVDLAQWVPLYWNATGFESQTGKSKLVDDVENDLQRRDADGFSVADAVRRMIDRELERERGVEMEF
jgi:hypothetical protein